MDIWRGIRWDTVTNLSGVGATGTAMALSRPCRLYGLEGIALTAAGSLALYDHTNRPQNLVGVITAGPTAPYQWPHVPVHRDVQRGLYVSFSLGTGGLVLGVGWDAQ